MVSGSSDVGRTWYANKTVNNPLMVFFYVPPDSDREDPAAESRASVLVVAPKQMSSALGSLVANYGSMSESESDEPEGEFTSCSTEIIHKIHTDTLTNKIL